MTLDDVKAKVRKLFEALCIGMGWVAISGLVPFPAAAARPLVIGWVSFTVLVLWPAYFIGKYRGE